MPQHVRGSLFVDSLKKMSDPGRLNSQAFDFECLRPEFVARHYQVSMQTRPKNPTIIIKKTTSYIAPILFSIYVFSLTKNR
jgi:hypothetical protein